MSPLEKDVAHLAVDWAKVKEILNDVLAGLDSVIAIVPAGLAKSILLGVSTSLHLVVSLLPAS